MSCRRAHHLRSPAPSSGKLEGATGGEGYSAHQRIRRSLLQAYKKCETRTKKACRWYAQVTHVRYVSFGADELPEKHRKLLEQALAIWLKPEFYGQR
jgi:hypothetical protein